MKLCWCESVWDALSNSHGEAATLKACSALMIALAELIRRRGWTQRQAVRRFGLAQPRVSDLVRGRIGLFPLAAPVGMAALACSKPRPGGAFARRGAV